MGKVPSAEGHVEYHEIVFPVSNGQMRSLHANDTSRKDIGYLRLGDSVAKVDGRTEFPEPQTILSPQFSYGHADDREGVQQGSPDL
jgi:hypothetical protein